MKHETAHLPHIQCRECGIYEAKPPPGMDWGKEECTQGLVTLQALIVLEGTLEPHCAETARKLINLLRNAVAACP